MKLKILLSLVFVLLASSSFAQVDTAWVSRYNGIGNGIDYGRAVVADANGNVYVTGRTLVSGSEDAFGTVKYDSDGNEIWVRRYYDPVLGDDYGNDLALDASGNICVTGASTGSGTAYDYVTIKYGPTGDTAWIQKYQGIGGSNTDWPTAIVVDNSDNVYVTGYSYGITGKAESATVKYNSSGVQQWAKRLCPAGADTYYGRDIAVDNAGNSYVTGETRLSGITRDYVTVKYLSNGTEDWVRTYNGTGNGSDYGRAIAVDGSGNVYVTGMSRGTLGYDYATVKYLSDGTEDWVERYNADGSNSDDAKDVVVDGSGNIYVTGQSKTTATNYDYATIKYTPDGGTEWIRRYNAFDAYDGGAALAVDVSDNVYVTGRIQEGTYYDYATIKYSTDGTEEWVVRYNGTGNQSDYVQDIFVDGQKNVYVTGYSRNASGNDDYATVKYSPPSVGIELLNFEAIGRAGHVELRWSTAVEIDNYKWLIYRSDQCNADYEKIAEMRSLGDGPNNYEYVDSAIEAANTYWYKLGDMDRYGNISWHDPVVAIPHSKSQFALSLLPIYPNPFKNIATIHYSLEKPDNISLKVYDQTGRLAKSLECGVKQSGNYTAKWNGFDNSNKKVRHGIYFIHLKSSHFSITKKIILFE